MIPNEFSEMQSQVVEPQKEPRLFKFSDINFGGIFFIILLILLGCIGWIVIGELSELGGNLGTTVKGWLDGASIDLGDRRGLTRFFKLLLTAGFIGILLILFGRK